MNVEETLAREVLALRDRLSAAEQERDQLRAALESVAGKVWVVRRGLWVNIDPNGTLPAAVIGGATQDRAKAAEARVEAAEQALRFYADPETYFAIGFLPDPPCGAFLDDFEQTHLGMKPGKRARAALRDETP